MTTTPAESSDEPNIDVDDVPVADPTLDIAMDILPLPASTVRRQAPVRTTVAGHEIPGQTTDAEELDVHAATDAEQSLADLGAERTPDGLVLTLPETILFEFDSAELRSEADDTIERVAELLTYFADVSVEVRGHTDNVGADDYNQQLSEQRAGAVVDSLVSAGVPAERMTPIGFGPTDPVTPNTNADGSDNPEGREQNRRVEIVLREE